MKPDGYSMQGKPLPPEKMDEDEVLRLARQRAMDSQSYWTENFDRAEKSVRFAEGEQWGAEERTERTGRPCLTLNTLPSFIEQVAGSQRQSRPAIKVIPGDDHGAEMEFAEGAKQKRKIAGAEVYGGIIRAIEQNSGAEAHYDTAFEHTLDGGLGWLRVFTRYASAKDFDQELLIRAVRNRWSVLIDPLSQEPDASDMAFAFIGDEMRKSEFTRRYPEARLGDVVDGLRVSYWMHDDLVRVAEYFTREPKTRELLLFSNGQTAYADELPEGTFDGEALIGVANDDGSPIAVVRRRKVVTWCVYWRKITAWETLEGPIELPFSTIPVIPVMGRRRDYRDGTFKLSSLIWPAMDAKRMENYWLPLSLDTPIPTPSGWTTMGTIKPGDRVFDERGRPCEVLGKSPVHLGRECFRVEFEDGTTIVADGEHPWVADERGKKTRNSFDWKARKLTTRDLRPGIHYIRTPEPLVTPPAALPVDPYVLGYWLGNGSTAAIRVTAATKDAQHVMREFASRGYPVGAAQEQPGAVTFSAPGAMAQFRALGVVGNKHIPAAYLRASQEQRLDLLRGLMDSDGSISASLVCTFNNTNAAIIDGFVELLRSFGIRSATQWRAGRVSKMANGHEIISNEIGQVSFTPPADPILFSLARKADRQRSKGEGYPRRLKRFGIKAVVPVPSVPVQCIGVSSESHLFLAGPSMIPTHNSAATERVALSPKAPWIATAEAIEGYERMWENANRGNPSVLIFNEGSTPPQRADVSAMPVAELQMASSMSDRVKSTIGMFNPSLGEDSSEKSGRAIALRQRQADNGTFAFVDNLSRALRRIGLLLIEAIPKIYDTERVMRLRNEDGTSAWVKVNQVITGPDGQEVVVNALGQGEFDVVVDTGPSYATQRQEAAEGQMAFLQINPAAAPLIGDKIVRNMDWPGADGIADRLVRAVPPQMLTPQEREEMQADQGQPQMGPDGQPMPPQPSPEEQAQAQQAQMAEMQMQAAQAETQAKVAQAEASMADADAKKATAEAVKAKAAADMAEAEVRMAALQMMPPSLPPQLPIAGQQEQQYGV